MTEFCLFGRRQERSLTSSNVRAGAHGCEGGKEQLKPQLKLLLRLRFCCVSAFLHSELLGFNLTTVEPERGTFPLIKPH